MSSEFYLALAGTVVWTGFGAYLAFLAFAQRKLARRLDRLEKLAHEK